MGWVVRGVALACAGAAVAALGAPATAAPGPVTRRPASVQGTSSSAFIDALSAIPDAAKALRSVRATLQTVKTNRAVAQAIAAAAATQYAQRSEEAHDAQRAQGYAERAVTGMQDALDDAARAMYTSGGSVPTLAEVMLTADSSTGFTRSLVIRQYLQSAAGNVLVARENAQTELARIRSTVASANNARDTAALGMVHAQETVAAADAEVAATKAEVKKAKGAYQRLMRITSADRSADYGKVKKCGDWLTKLLSKSGFSGEDLREAWSIVMRESGGREDAVSATGDLGLFQINTDTWKKQPWFDRKELLTRTYNARIGHLLSKGGNTWYSWGLDGHGRPDPRAYVKAGWTPEHIYSSIIAPYILWYSLYPCRPAYEKDVVVNLPEPIAADSEAVLPQDLGLEVGAGVQPGERPQDVLPSLEPVAPAA